MNAERSLRDEFAFKNGDARKGCRSLAIHSALYIGLPLIAYAFLLTRTIRPAMMNDVTGYLTVLILVTVPLIALSFFIGFYRAGSRSKMMFRLLSSIYLSAAILILSNAGWVSILLRDIYSKGRVTISLADISVDMTWLIWLTAAIVLLIGLLSIVEYRDSLESYEQSINNNEAR